MERRRKFVKLAVQHPKHAAAILRMFAIKIEKAKSENETFDVLEELLHLSERTLRYDYKD